MIRLLIVTGEKGVKTGFNENLGRYGFTGSVTTYDDALETVAEEVPDLVMVEMENNLPDSRAWETIRALKKRENMPVISLVRAELLEGFDSNDEIGDFITVPYDIRELALRVKRLLHLRKGLDSSELIRIDGLMIDTARCEVTVGGHIAQLTFKEYELLKLLASNPGRVFTRQSLLDKVWGYDYFGGDRTVDVHVRRLRSKVEDAHHAFIETVRNIGYRFRKVI